MIAKEQIQRITDIAQEKGWSVNVEDKNETRVLFEFQRYNQANARRYQQALNRRKIK